MQERVSVSLTESVNSSCRMWSQFHNVDWLQCRHMVQHCRLMYWSQCLVFPTTKDPQFCLIFLCQYIPCSAFLYIPRWSPDCVTICHRLAWIHLKFSVKCTEAFTVGCYVACCSIKGGFTLVTLLCIVTLQVTLTIRSYELNFHPVPHGVTVPASVTPWGSQFVTGVWAMSLQLAGVSYICIYITLKRKREKSGGDGKGSCKQAGNCTAVQVCW